MDGPASKGGIVLVLVIDLDCQVVAESAEIAIGSIVSVDIQIGQMIHGNADCAR
jgi:hypothetical protein